MRRGSEGPNWLLLAGGAAVTALSFVIRRRQKHEFEDRMEERVGKSDKAELANHNGLPTAPALSHGTSTGLDDALHANYHHDRQQIPSSVELFEEEKSFQRRDIATQEDVSRGNQQGVQIGLTAKRDMVHRLRKQLKSRDEMILRMQVQISEYERSLSLSDARVSELQARLEVTGGVLSDLDKEVQLFRNQLASLLKFDAKMEDCNQSAVGGAEFTTSCVDERRDMNLTLLELTKLREVLDRLKEETTARDIERQALLQEYNSMLEKVEYQECALKEQRMLVSEKEQVLDMNQVELLKVTSRLQAQVEETESLRHTKAKLEACIHNLNSRGLSRRDLHSSEEIISSTSAEVSDSSSHPLQGQGDPKLLDTCHDFEMDFLENINDPVISENVVTALQQEVEQLSAALASKSKVIEQKEQTTRLVKDLQAEYTKETMLHILDSVPETLKPEDPKWLHLSQQLSSSTSLATPSEVNELNIKLIESAKCKQVEEEMADIRKHQAKIAELRQKIANLTQDSTDEVRNEQSLHVTALICGLAEKLAAQEEQAKQTALEVQQLSMFFQLLTPIVAKLQDRKADLPLAGQPNSGEIISCDVGHVKFNFSSIHPKHAGQGGNINKTEPGLQDSDTSSDSSTFPSNQISPDYMLTELVDDDYQFRVGASGPLATKIRRFSSKWDRNNARKKKPFTHAYGSGSDADLITSGYWATKSEGDKDLYRQERVINTDMPQYNQQSLGSFVEFQDSESRSIPVEEEQNGYNTWAVQQKNRYFPYEVEQVMAAGTPDTQAIDFMPTLEEFSPLVRQVRSPRQGIESSRRYLFNAGNNQGDLANSTKASSGYPVTAAESSLEEEAASERSFLVERFEAASVSPFSKMIARLDSTEELPDLQEASVEHMLPDSPQNLVEDEARSLEEGNTSLADRLILIEDVDGSEANTSIANGLIVSKDINESDANAPVAGGSIETGEDVDDSVSEAASDSRGSIDSEFDEMLDGTLDDLVKIFSTTVTPASTPTSSVLSQNSGSKSFQYF